MNLRTATQRINTMYIPLRVFFYFCLNYIYNGSRNNIIFSHFTLHIKTILGHIVSHIDNMNMTNTKRGATDESIKKKKQKYNKKHRTKKNIENNITLNLTKNSTENWGFRLHYISRLNKVAIRFMKKNCITRYLNNVYYVVSIEVNNEILNMIRGNISIKRYETMRVLMSTINEMTMILRPIKDEIGRSIARDLKKIKKNHERYIEYEGDDVENIDEKFKNLKLGEKAYARIGERAQIFDLYKIEKNKHQKCRVHLTMKHFLSLRKHYYIDEIVLLKDFGRKSVKTDTNIILKSTRESIPPNYFIVESSREYSSTQSFRSCDKLWNTNLFWTEMKKWKDSLDFALYNNMEIDFHGEMVTKMFYQDKSGHEWWQILLQTPIVDAYPDIIYLVLRYAVVPMRNLSEFNIEDEYTK